MSVAPFSALADRYGDDLAILWIDSHPDVGTGASEYPGYHAMAVSALVGRADPEVQALLPTTVSPTRVAVVGLHAWTDDDFPNIDSPLTNFTFGAAMNFVEIGYVIWSSIRSGERPSQSV